MDGAEQVLEQITFETLCLRRPGPRPGPSGGNDFPQTPSRGCAPSQRQYTLDGAVARCLLALRPRWGRTARKPCESPCTPSGRTGRAWQRTQSILVPTPSKAAVRRKETFSAQGVRRNGEAAGRAAFPVNGAYCTAAATHPLRRRLVTCLLFVYAKET